MLWTGNSIKLGASSDSLISKFLPLPQLPLFSVMNYEMSTFFLTPTNITKKELFFHYKARLDKKIICWQRAVLDKFSTLC